MTGVTDKLFMCQMFMCLFRPLETDDKGFAFSFPDENGVAVLLMPPCGAPSRALAEAPQAPRFSRAPSGALPRALPGI